MKKKETSCIILILVDGFGASIRKVDSIQLIPDGVDLIRQPWEEPPVGRKAKGALRQRQR